MSLQLRNFQALLRPLSNRHILPRTFCYPPSEAIRTHTRTMSADSKPKQEWIAILPDKVGALDRRMSVRQEHFAGLNRDAEKGLWKLGGAFLEDVPKEGEGLKIKGSVMVAQADTKEEVLEALKADPYARADVWDWDAVQIYPFKIGVLKP
ncbi:hypothetical protein L228DRAFT_244566 [Xylona heveae TC161]|uniref:YCII-related domain-containing protein n=1 Tax=Xylona heveae (strain CBS 132557 / TC161) TaxID=1328760 RepID=A0A165J3G6_XYLHT|nr:hypothetical protein L228DRAFT_244566 [Xylona heveae TC161]KZF25679.1 hypothetical protein L228DRAFT_244566 [Xylona heveae TC161]